MEPCTVQGPLLSDYTTNEDQMTPKALKVDVASSVLLRRNRHLNGIVEHNALIRTIFVYCTDMSRFLL